MTERQFWFSFLIDVFTKVPKSFLARRRAYKRAERGLLNTPALTLHQGEKFTTFWFRRQVAITIAMSKDQKANEEHCKEWLSKALDEWIRHELDLGLFWGYPRSPAFKLAICLRENQLREHHRAGPALIDYAVNGTKFP